MNLLCIVSAIFLRSVTSFTNKGIIRVGRVPNADVSLQATYSSYFDELNLFFGPLSCFELHCQYCH